MNDPHHLLSLVWAFVLAFGILAYVILDGFDLGVGILFVFIKERHERDVMVTSIAPFWDGNETWLVFGGAGLYAMFPLAYSVILPALYPLVIVMLLGLILRGVSFEFRFRALRVGRFWWDVAFCAGSIAAAAAQGLILGGLLQGIKVNGGVYAGGWWDWLTPFTLVCGLATVIGYAALGACWLIWRTEPDLQDQFRRLAAGLGAGTLALTVLVSIATPFLHPQYARRWFHWPGVLLTSPVPILLAALAALFCFGLLRKRDWLPLVCGELWFALCIAGLGISLHPLIVPPDITIFEAASPARSQAFLLVGAVIIIPIILAYNGYAYWIFRGKVRHGEAYH